MDRSNIDYFSLHRLVTTTPLSSHGIFEEGEFELVFIEIDRGGGHRNDVVRVVYRPPRVALSVFNQRMAQLLGMLGE
jgi:hypothetical protein